MSTFIEEIAPFAVLSMMRSRVLASITMAQGMLESAEGHHAPGNNFFGIKSTDGTGQLLWTQEYENGQWIQVQAWFKVYPDLEGCIEDHSDFLTVNTRYARYGFFTACDNLDFKSAAQALHDAGYATDPGYAQSLINLIEQNGLDAYDREAVNNLQAITNLQNDVAALKVLTAGLVKTPPPAWFITEFGSHALDGIVLDLNGDADFWRDTAISLRLKAKG